MFSRHDLRLIVHCVFLDQSQDGEWGGELELQALANVIELPITVVRPVPAPSLVYDTTPSTIYVPGAARLLQLQPLRNQSQQRVLLSHHSSETVAGHYKCLSLPRDEDGDQEMKSVDEGKESGGDDNSNSKRRKT